MTDLLLRDATLPDGSVGDVAIADGVFVDAAGAGRAREELDATGLHVLPGVVDAHVHFNEPGRTDWEGWRHGSHALAAGGGTTAVEMPLNAHPPTCDAAAFDAKRAAAEASSVVDFALWGGLVPGNRGELAALAERGVVGLKAFMSTSGVEDFRHADDRTLLEGMQEAAALGLPVAVHAESDALTTVLAAREVAAGRRGMRDYLRSRPVVAELEAITRALAFAEATGCALHVVHVSSGRGVALVAQARARGVDATCETCPHYLLLDEEDAVRIGALAKCAPPLRPAAERDALWAALADGTLPMVASDHSPSPLDMKDGADAFAIWGGIAGCQSLLELLLTFGVRDRGVALDELADLTAGFPARRLRLHGKGTLAPGADGDLVLVELGPERVLEAAELHSRHQASVYCGLTLAARVRRTVVRGRTVYADGRVHARGGGRLVRPA